MSTDINTSDLPLVPWPQRVQPAPTLRLPRVVRGWDEAGAVAQVLSDDLSRITGELLLSSGDGPAIVLSLDETVPGEEGYRLITAEDRVTITASTAQGLYRGTRTLLQLLARDADGWTVRGAQIEDAPRYPYRGAMLDVSRHFFDVPVVLGVIDRIADLKLNALHLHLSDDQGFRLAIESHPELTELGSTTQVGGTAGGYYTAQDYAAIVAYAAQRWITVVPEIDMPSHSHAIQLSHPEAVDSPIRSTIVLEQSEQLGQPLPEPGQPYTHWVVGFSSLRDRPQTWPLVRDILRDVAAQTPGPYLHIGGDEAHGTPPEEFDAFVAKASRIVTELGKTPIAWHEAARSPELDSSTIAQYWGYTTADEQVQQAVDAFVARGGRIIASPADAAYLDMKYTDDFPLGLTWADGPTTVQQSYAWDPHTVFASDAARAAVLGVESPLWTETVESAGHIDTMMFPRLASTAEIGWSSREPEQRSWQHFRARVGALGPAWMAAGIDFFRSPEIDWA